MNTNKFLWVIISTVMWVFSAAHAMQFDFETPLDWTTSDNSVYSSDGCLIIDADGGVDDYAEKQLSLTLSPDSSIVITTRLKLVSGGNNYKLPWTTIFFEDSPEAMVLYTTYIGEDCGWIFLNDSYYDDWDSWYNTDNFNHPVPEENYWVITKIVLTSIGCELYMNPDDGTNEFYQIASQTYSHSSIEKIRISQPWDSVNYIDYVSIIPEPATMLLLTLGGMIFRKRK